MNDPHLFHPFSIEDGTLLDLSESPHPTVVRGARGCTTTLPGNETHYGIVVDGEVAISDDHGTLNLGAGMFFCVPGPAAIDATVGAALCIGRVGTHAMRQFGGPIESYGRLRYIDGCTDTLLVCPGRLGEPCLNHLHIPPGTRQSRHTHPSELIGVILRGRGECRTPSGTWALEPGMAWRIPTGCLHSFFTTDHSLDVIAWHPDSDFGPTDEDHPMRNRTLLERA